MSDPNSPATPTDPGTETTETSSYAPKARATTKVRLTQPGRVFLGVAAVVIVVVVGVIAYLVFFQRSDPTAAKVGDCVSITGSANIVTATRLSCADEKALYVVVAAGRGVACDAYEVSYTDRTKLCLFYNVAVGDCLKVTQSGDGDAKGACAAGMLKVVSVRTDTSEFTKCPAESDAARVDETRNRLICFAGVR